MGGTAFQFKFALQPGDYSQNGIVDMSDYNVWRVGDPRADGDGDGIVGTASDYNVWRDAIDQYLWLQRWQGDYNKDGVVNGLDYTLWRLELDNVYDPNHPENTRGDGDLDGVVTYDDELIWHDWLNTLSPWNISIMGVAAGSSLVDSTKRAGSGECDDQRFGFHSHAILVRVARGERRATANCARRRSGYDCDYV